MKLLQRMNYLSEFIPPLKQGVFFREVMRPNIILIVLDTFRKDNFNALLKQYPFKEDFIVYPNCIASSTWTVPSHVSLFTGETVKNHGIHETRYVKVTELFETGGALLNGKTLITEDLRKLGYSTYCYTSNPLVSKDFGFLSPQHFDEMILTYNSPWRSEAVEEARSYGSNIIQVIDSLKKQGKLSKLPSFGLAWIKAQAEIKLSDYPNDKGSAKIIKLLKEKELKEPFFLFINFFNLHEPYPSYNEKDTMENLVGVKKTTDEEVAKLKEEYDAIAVKTMKQLHQLLKVIEDKGYGGNSLIIITSDHGQAFNEHGFMYHGIFLYDEIIRVPLVIKYPHLRYGPAHVLDQYNITPHPEAKGYQSLANIKNLILDVINGKGDERLTISEVVSESFGSHMPLAPAYEAQREYFNQMYEQERKRVFRD